MSWAPGRYGSGLKFDGTKGCVTIPDSPVLQVREQFSLEAWVRPEGELFHLPAITKQSLGQRDVAARDCSQSADIHNGSARFRCEVTVSASTDFQAGPLQAPSSDSRQRAARRITRVPYGLRSGDGVVGGNEHDFRCRRSDDTREAAKAWRACA